ncbi:MAG TPA: hypothetical protein VFC65_05350 [Prolixibacteraceae bacterium]|nr:hypothetical protein [Prolixibacteraceae bacterium]
MKRFALYILIVLPGITSAQLFPKVPELKGNIERVVEKRYGKEANYLKLLKGIFQPKIYTGWKYTYLFDKNSNLRRRTNTFHGKVKADYLYQHDTIDNRNIEREIITNSDNINVGDYVEYEYLTGPSDRVWKVNFWSFNSRECTRKLFQIEQNAEYNDGRLVSFTRHQLNENGDTSSGEKCTIYYDYSDRIIRIERKDIESDFKTIIQYYYNNRGLVSHYSVDFLVELQEYGKTQIQDISYKYDRHGNWNRMYWNAGTKNRLEAKRNIKYY